MVISNNSINILNNLTIPNRQLVDINQLAEEEEVPHMEAAVVTSRPTFTTIKQGNSRNRQTYKSIKHLCADILKLRARAVWGIAVTLLMGRLT